MTRGNGQSLSVDPVEMMKLMAQMQRCFLGGSLGGNIPMLGMTAEEEAERREKIKGLGLQLRSLHEESWTYYHGQNKQVIVALTEKMKKIGESLYELRKAAKDAKEKRTEYMNKFAKTAFSKDMVREMVHNLNEEAKEYLKEAKKHNPNQTQEFFKNAFPEFHAPKFMSSDSDKYPMRKIMTWLRHTKRRAFTIVYQHIKLNTQSPSDTEPTHGRALRTREMERFMELHEEALKIIAEIRAVRRNGEGGVGLKRKKESGEGGKGRRQRRRKGKAAPGAAYGLTPFPYLHDYDDY